ncbi:glycosyl transferase [Mucilaginibacter sp. PAMC 26640]|nr:glycosyl transferase [Mucilaginibacter sp. PAMC 26640]
MFIFSHLRWDFVYQRPQHLATRLAEHCKVYYIEEPVFDATDNIYYRTEYRHNIQVLVPHLLPGFDHDVTINGLSQLFSNLIETIDLQNTAFWYYTPMALEFSDRYEPGICIYDCMDELSAFKFAPPSMQLLERNLLNKADLVFTGGKALYHAKKDSHHNIHAFPSSIDKAHFSKARHVSAGSPDQNAGKKIKLGFYGVIDERFDIELIRDMADARPEWDFILIGPIVKIDQETLPRMANIHYLGSKTYDQLPECMADWDIALIPFLLNESTRFISPTKTPEYLAAGLPVISTPIADVVDPYGVNNLVGIGSSAKDFIRLAEMVLQNTHMEEERLEKVDLFLANNSWDLTFEGMREEILKVIKQNHTTLTATQYV